MGRRHGSNSRPKGQTHCPDGHFRGIGRSFAVGFAENWRLPAPAEVRSLRAVTGSARTVLARETRGATSATPLVNPERAPASKRPGAVMTSDAPPRPDNTAVERGKREQP